MDEVVVQDDGALVAKIVLRGDLSDLKPREKVQYYNEFCHALGLNPLTRPFEYIKMNGKIVLYANKSCTEQLRKRDNISVFDKTIDQFDDVYVVTVKVRNGDGREDIASGALRVDGLKGDDLANALMKAETKAKRRATLSICGLGVVDEVELDTVDVQYVTDEELDKAKATILQLFEDNAVYLEPDYITSTTMDVDYAVEQRDITGLEAMYSEVVEVLKKAKAPEIKDMTEMGFKKASEGFADKATPLPEAQADLDIY